MRYTKILLATGASAVLLPSAFATVAIEADTLEGLPWMGSDVGDFLKNLAPGIGTFIIILGVFGGVAAIVYSVVSMIKNKVTV